MEWKELSSNPLLINNFNLLQDLGILQYIDQQQVKNKELEQLLNEAYQLFQKQSITDIAEFIIYRLSDKFIPSNLFIILNEGIMVNRIKTIAFRNMQSTDVDLGITSLKPYEKFFLKYSGTTSFLILKNELDDPEAIAPIEACKPEIVVPILGISGLYGIILFGSKILSEEYSAGEIAYINQLMRFTSISIQNTIHYENSVKESKTGLFNHNYFLSRVKEEISRSKRNYSPFSIMVLDIDKFKHFNDTYGHLAGDEVILSMAKTLNNTIRQGDVLSRFGGEEFTILLPDTDADKSWIAAERIRKTIEAMVARYQDHVLKVTVSIGVASIHPYKEMEAEELLKRADEALYKSKENGRNQVTHYKTGLLNQALDKTAE